jgi:hypothetical protein
MYNERLTEALAIVGVKHAASLNGTDILITDIDIAKYKRLLFILDVGTTFSTSVDAKLRESKTSGGTYQDITSGAITQITAASKLATIEIRADQLDPGYEFVQLSITTGGATTICAVCLGGEGVHKPVGGAGPANDVASVTQRLVVPGPT